MNRNKYRFLSNARASDDKRLIVQRRDFSGGENTRQHASRISENQCEVLQNFDISVPGQTRKIPGTDLSADIGNNAGVGAFGFEPRGGTNELYVAHGTVVSGCTSPSLTGTDAYTNHVTGLTTGLQTTIIKATCSGANGDVVLVANGTDNLRQVLQDHTVGDCLDDNYACPKTTVIHFYRNRLWALKANCLYWSDALPSTYISNTSSAPFDRTTNYYNMTVGEERALVGLWDVGIIAFGQDAVYGINPSTTPAATDKPEKILDIGCVAGKTACQVGDDVLFLAPDGVRGVFRTQQDKLQQGQSVPLSYSLKTEHELINWNAISKACAVYFDNKYFIALPTGSAAYNNRVWVYYPATKSWVVIVGWNVGAWAKMKVSGEEQLFYIDSNDGSVYGAWTGYTNNGTAITSTLVGREEDCGYAMQDKTGGEVEIEAETAGSGNSVKVYAAINGSSFQFLDSVSLDSESSPTLPVSLPFSLADSTIIRYKIHLDSIEAFRTIQFKFVNDDANVDPVIIYGYNLITFAEEYKNE